MYNLDKPIKTVFIVYTKTIKYNMLIQLFMVFYVLDKIKRIYLYVL